jgi:hypothetical protein
MIADRYSDNSQVVDYDDLKSRNPVHVDGEAR